MLQGQTSLQMHWYGRKVRCFLERMSHLCLQLLLEPQPFMNLCLQLLLEPFSLCSLHLLLEPQLLKASFS